MTKLINIITIIVSIISLTACTEGFLKKNSDPYAVDGKELSRDGYAIRLALTGIADGVISPDVNTTQFTECLLGGTMAGYLADANAGWANTISNYNPTDNWTNVFMQSDRIIPMVYTNYAMLYRITDNPVLLAVGDVMKVAAMHRVVDTYGPVPYSKIGVGGKLQVEYDSQADAYKTMIEELDAAAEVLMNYRTTNFASNSDIIYGGVTEKWAKFANSLRLRLAMRISYADPELSKKTAEAAVNNEVGVIISNDDNAQRTTFGVDGNPINVAVKYNMAQHTPACVTGGDSHAAADIVTYMNGYEDPRRGVFFTASEWSNSYEGLRRGIIIPDHATTGHKYSGVNIDATSSVVWMNAAEVAFLRAEAVAVFGFDMGGEAKDFYEDGIRLSFEQWSAGSADAYIADNSRTPSAYVDPAGTNTYGGALSSITVAWDDAATVEQKQERIITQKWIANWLLGNESWADWRRTGYPVLIPATETGNKSNGIVDSAKGARRMPYPSDEYVNNASNIAEAVSTKLRGADNMSTRLWFDCKPNNPSYIE